MKININSQYVPHSARFLSSSVVFCKWGTLQTLLINNNVELVELRLLIKVNRMKNGFSSLAGVFLVQFHYIENHIFCT